jgi:tRNA pseudouridine38-40 synthase
MKLAASHFVGTKDFASYMAADTKIKDTVRTIYEAEVCRNGDVIEFRVSANGFLYNTV